MKQNEIKKQINDIKRHYDNVFTYRSKYPQVVRAKYKLSSEKADWLSDEMTRFFYLTKTTVIGAVTEHQPDENGNDVTITMCFSVCLPIDLFSKRTGVLVALQNMENDFRVFYIHTTKDNAAKKFLEAARQIVSNHEHRKSNPLFHI